VNLYCNYGALKGRLIIEICIMYQTDSERASERAYLDAHRHRDSVGTCDYLIFHPTSVTR
jgi:hypothetical protein